MKHSIILHCCHRILKRSCARRSRCVQSYGQRRRMRRPSWYDQERLSRCRNVISCSVECQENGSKAYPQELPTRLQRLRFHLRNKQMVASVYSSIKRTIPMISEPYPSSNQETYQFFSKWAIVHDSSGSVVYIIPERIVNLSLNPRKLNSITTPIFRISLNIMLGLT